MESVTLDYAREHLDELLRRARNGESVEIADPLVGTFKLQPVGNSVAGRPKRKPGSLKGTLPPPPDDFFDPLTEEELKLWYGDDA